MYTWQGEKVEVEQFIMYVSILEKLTRSNCTWMSETLFCWLGKNEHLLLKNYEGKTM